MPSQPLNTFLTTPIALIGALPSVRQTHRDRVDHTLIPDNQWPFVAVYPDDARVIDNLSMAQDYDHSITVLIYGRTEDDCREVREDIIDAINANHTMSGSAINCWPSSLTTTWGMDQHGKRFIDAVMLTAKLRRYL